MNSSMRWVLFVDDDAGAGFDAADLGCERAARE
jgi:hypothetical protein